MLPNRSVLCSVFKQAAIIFWNCRSLPGKNIKQTHLITAIIGISSLLFLFWARRGLKPLLKRLGLGTRSADLRAKMGPAVVVITTTVIVWGLGLTDKGVMVVGTVPKGPPSISIPGFDMSVRGKLLITALLISIVGYVESISVAMTLAAKRRQRIDPDQKLIALGAANIGSAISGGLPVTGGFSRSVVNFDAGAETPAAGAFTAVGIAIATLFLTPLLFLLPNSVLAATIMVAVLSLVVNKTLKHTYSYSIIDFIAMVATILFTWIKGVEAGLLAGVGLSVILHLFQISKPHVAVLGQVPGTEQFLNISRNEVVIDPEIVSLRVDASLYF